MIYVVRIRLRIIDRSRCETRCVKTIRSCVAFRRKVSPHAPSNRSNSTRLTLPRVMNFTFLLRPHQEYYITQYGELGFSKLSRGWKIIILPNLTTSLKHFSFGRLGECIRFELGGLHRLDQSISPLTRARGPARVASKNAGVSTKCRLKTCRGRSMTDGTFGDLQAINPSFVFVDSASFGNEQNCRSEATACCDWGLFTGQWKQWTIIQRWNEMTIK